jgi:hypothetical protein
LPEILRPGPLISDVGFLVARSRGNSAAGLSAPVKAAA